MARVGCDASGCGGKHFCKGYCQMHYQRVKRWKHAGPHYPRCAYVGPHIGQCPARVRKRGESYCYKHRQQLERTGVYADGDGPRGLG